MPNTANLTNFNFGQSLPYTQKCTCTLFIQKLENQCATDRRETDRISLTYDLDFQSQPAMAIRCKRSRSEVSLLKIVERKRELEAVALPESLMRLVKIKQYAQKRE